MRGDRLVRLLRPDPYGPLWADILRMLIAPLIVLVLVLVLGG